MPNPLLKYPTKHRAAKLYSMWLSGYSLRQLGAMHGCSQVAIFKAINRKFGKGATSFKRVSMARSVIRDYGQMPPLSLLALLQAEGVFRSIQTMDGVTKNMGILYEHQNYNICEPDPTEYLPDLKWYYFRMLADYMVNILSENG